MSTHITDPSTPAAVRAVILSASGYGGAAFAQTIPTEPLLRMDTMQWTTAMRLLLSVPSPSPLPIHCRCRRPGGRRGLAPGDLDVWGHHLTTCGGIRGNSYIRLVHDGLVRDWEAFFRGCGFNVQHEHRLNERVSAHRIDFYIHDFFGSQCGFDVSLASPTASSSLLPAQGSSVSPGYASRSREAEKRRHYANIAQARDLIIVPLVFETSGGAWGPTARDVFRRAIRYSRSSRDALNRAGLAYNQLAAYWVRRLSTRLAAMVATHTHQMIRRLTSDLRDDPASGEDVATSVGIQIAAGEDRFGSGLGPPGG